jgi:hypothetical protein
MPDKKLTPMMELIEWATKSGRHLICQNEIKEKANELLEKERQMVVDAYGQPRVYFDEDFQQMDEIDGEQYYTKTYKS